MKSVERLLDFVVNMIEKGEVCEECLHIDHEEEFCNYCNNTKVQNPDQFIDMSCIEVIHMKSIDSYAGSKVLYYIEDQTITIDFSINAVVANSWGEKCFKFFESTQNTKDIERALERHYGWY
jgi:recombinational DNA repair protein RecR